MAKLRLGLLFGGRSLEHEVSLVSATSILAALDPARYQIFLIAVDHEGRWRIGSGASLMPETIARDGTPITLPPVPGEAIRPDPTAAGAVKSLSEALTLDVVFPIIHGRGGEDGALQGLLELAEVAYVGSGVLSSAVQMDKDVAKRLLAAAGLPVVPWCTLRSFELAEDGVDSAAEACARKLGLPLFVKPANSGSSVGISRAEDERELAEGLREAARYDTKILVERGLDAREVEVAVLGNEEPMASVPGEIRPGHDFYDYEAKYEDESTELLVPAPLEAPLAERLRTIAIDAYRTLEAEGMARVDFLIERSSGTPYVNELNSLPGFTDVSMVPRLWEASGLAYPKLLDRLIELALERKKSRDRLETSYRPRR